MKRNIELKARYPDLAAACRVAVEIGAVLHGVEDQRDTYFRVPHGRLKLRERWGRVGDANTPAANQLLTGEPMPSQLIWYDRTNDSRPRGSDYLLVLIDDGEQLRGVLKNSLEVISQVVKHRAVYLRDNVRIHLDDVAGLGTYIEFEAIVDENCDDATARLKIDFLLHAFGIEPETVASLSYGELIGS
jgi:adenylate cyclase class IV